MELVLDDTIRMPAGFANLSAFRRWTKSADYPDRGEFCYLGGELWVDLAMETLLHNQLKLKIATALTLLVVEPKSLGCVFGDRMRLVSVTADLSTEPDCMYVSRDALRTRRVRLDEGAESLEVIGTPDMVLEVVSRSSIQKDTVTLREHYANAGIPEYWLVNPLGDELSFDILRLTARGYVATRKIAGWVKSSVFQKSFRWEFLDSEEDLPNYRLLVR